jgi:microcystin-dependent protein
MQKTKLPQQNTLNQTIADGKTAVFNYTYLILIAEDIAVFVTNPEDEANPDKDLQVLNQDYTVQAVGTMTGGTITFVKDKIPTAGAIVTLVRNMQISIETEFGNAQSFNGNTLDAAFERVLLIMQQFNTQLATEGLQYIINSYLTSNLSNKLPVLTTQDNQVWISQGGRIIAAQTEKTDTSTLRSELSSQASHGGDGTHLLGYYDVLNQQGQTLQKFLNNLQSSDEHNGGADLIGFIHNNIKTTLGNLLKDLLTNRVYQTGDLLITGRQETERPGFLLCDGRAINRNEYADLFNAIGTQFGNGDGSTTFNIPNMARHIPVGAGGQATPTLGNTVGSQGGEEMHTMTLNELVAHAHQFEAGIPLITGGAAGRDVTGNKTTFATSATGNSQPFNIMQPCVVFNYFIKY